MTDPDPDPHRHASADSNTGSSADAWWRLLYSEAFADAYLERRRPSDIETIADFVVGQCALELGARVFDQCCGVGAVGLSLAARGYRVEAIDQAAHYVAAARASASARGLALDLRVADAFTHVTRAPCRAVVNWWSSFGYAPSDATNVQMLARAFESLAPGGTLLLDTMNAAQVLRGFQARRAFESPTASGQVAISAESTVDLERGCLRKRWTIVEATGEQRRVDSEVRLYMPHELHDLMRSVGFRDVVCLGDLDGRPITLDSPRCIVKGVRP